MGINLTNPDGLPQVDLYRQVAVATGTRLVHVAGQVAWDADGHTVGPGDLSAQAEQCFVNVATALTQAGASLADLAKLTVYVVDWKPEKMPLIVEGLRRAGARLGADVTPLPPTTLLGIAAPFTPDLLVEIEATAMLD